MGIEEIIKTASKIKEKDRPFVSLVLRVVAISAISLVLISLISFVKFVLEDYFPPEHFDKPTTLPQKHDFQGCYFESSA